MVEELEELEKKNKKGLTAFILAVIALFVLFPAIWFCVIVAYIPYIGSLIYWVLWWGTAIAGLIISAVALGNAKKAKGITKNPHKVFRLLATIFGAIGLALFILRIVLRLLSDLLLLLLTVLIIVLAIVALILFVGYLAFTFLASGGLEAIIGTAALFLL